MPRQASAGPVIATINPPASSSAAMVLMFHTPWYWLFLTLPDVPRCRALAIGVFNVSTSPRRGIGRSAESGLGRAGQTQKPSTNVFSLCAGTL